MNRTKAIVAALLLLATTAHAKIYQNTSHEMAAGDFFGAGGGRHSVAWILASGQINVQDYAFGQHQLLTLPGGETAVKIVAADIDGNGQDDLGIVSSTGALRTYNMTTDLFSVPAGGNIQEISSANIDADARTEILVTNTTNVPYLFESGAFTGPIGGGGARGSALSAGEFDGDATEEFLMTGGSTPFSGSGLFFWSGEAPGWQVFDGGGSSIAAIAAGNLVTNDANHEALVRVTPSDALWASNGSFVYTNGVATQIDMGIVDADLGTQDLAYVVGTGGVIYQSKLAWATGNFASGYIFLPVDAVGDLTAVLNNSGFSDLLVADIDRDGLDEILARSGDTLYRFDNGNSAFVEAIPTPEPGTLTLLVLGGLGLLRRRRRKA